MFCVHCGASNAEGVKFCSSCGRPIGGDVVQRQGDLLVVARNAALPPNCVKCGQPATGKPLKKTFYWHTGWLYLLVLLHVIIYIIVALIVRKRFDLAVPLCEEHRRRRRRFLWTGGLLLLGGFAGGILLGSLVGGDEGLGWFFLVWIVFSIAGIVFLLTGGTVLRAKHIDNDAATFKGAGEGFLARLPALPR